MYTDYVDLKVEGERVFDRECVDSEEMVSDGGVVTMTFSGQRE